MNKRPSEYMLNRAKELKKINRLHTILAIVGFVGGITGSLLWGMVLAPSGVEPQPVENASVVAVLPEAENRAVLRDVSAYTSHVEQTDSTPCIGATGANLCHLYYEDGMSICAANFVPLGTELDLAGMGKCVVLDRMNSRYPESVDIYYGFDYDAAIEFGRKEMNITVL